MLRKFNAIGFPSHILKFDTFIPQKRVLNIQDVASTRRSAAKSKRENPKKYHFFTQKEHPAPQETEVLHEKLKTVLPIQILKKKSRPPKPVGFFLNENKKNEVLHEKLKTVLPMRILKKKISTPNFTKFLNP